MREAPKFDRLSSARAVVELKLARIHLRTSSASGSRVVHGDRRTLYVRVRQDWEMACRPSAGFGDLMGDWFDRNESGERTES